MTAGLGLTSGVPATDSTPTTTGDRMGKETRLFKSEERMTRGDASAFLRQLADKLAEGRVVLRRGQEAMELELPQHLVLEVQVEDEDKKAKGVEHTLEVEIKWFDGEQGGSLELG